MNASYAVFTIKRQGRVMTDGPSPPGRQRGNVAAHGCLRLLGGLGGDGARIPEALELRLKTLWRDGTSHLVLTELELVERLAVIGLLASLLPKAGESPTEGRGRTAASPAAWP